MPTTRKRRKSPRWLRNIKHRIEYAIVLVFLWMTVRIPLDAAEPLARTLGSFAFFVCRSRRAVAIENIVKSGIAQDDDALRIARDSFVHLIIVALETLRAAPFMAQKDRSDWLEMVFENGANQEILQPGSPAIFVSGHVGNWELCAQISATQRPVYGIARKMNNPYVNKLMTKRTENCQLELMDKRGQNARRLLRPLHSGDVLAVLFDQHAPGSNLMLEFFGRRAATHSSPAVLHILSGAPLYFMQCIRRGTMKYTYSLRRLTASKPSGDRDVDIRNVMRQSTDLLEAAIRAHPEQYLWMHRRWKLSEKRRSTESQNVKKACALNGATGKEPQ